MCTLACSPHSSSTTAPPLYLHRFISSPHSPHTLPKVSQCKTYLETNFRLSTKPECRHRKVIRVLEFSRHRLPFREGSDDISKMPVAMGTHLHACWRGSTSGFVVGCCMDPSCRLHNVFRGDGVFESKHLTTWVGWLCFASGPTKRGPPPISAPYSPARPSFGKRDWVVLCSPWNAWTGRTTVILVR